MKSILAFGLGSLLVLLVIPSIAAQGQTVELKSARLAVLEGQERERFVAAHNEARQAVKVEPLEWSGELGKHALESLEEQKESLIAEAKEGWTERLIPLPQHREVSPYGENVAAWAGSTRQPAESAVKLWLQEKAGFDKLNAKAPYRVGDEEGQTETDDAGQERPIIVGHYTAIVWRTTKQIGAARLDFELTDDRGETRRFTAIICNYNPPGNRLGKQPY